MFSFFQKRRIPAGQFEASAIAVLTRHISTPEDVREQLDVLKNVLALPDDANREKGCARIYLRLERHVSEDQPRQRIPKEVLREQIYRTCNAERAEGNFALIFLPSHLRKMRLFEQFVDLLLERTSSFVGAEGYDALLKAFSELDKEFSKHAREPKQYGWENFEKQFRVLSLDKQWVEIELFLGRVVGKIYNALDNAIGEVRAELTFTEVYQKFRDRLDFIDDVPQVLQIVPAGILQDAKVSIMPKTELEGEVRKRTEALESALSELREEKRKLGAALEKAESSDKAKSDFVSVVSHHLRTPLSAIRWSAEILKDEIVTLAPVEEEKLKLLVYINSIEERSIFLVNMLDDIFDVLAIEGRTAKLDKKPNQLWELISEVLDGVRETARVRGVELEFNRAAAPIKEMRIDKEKVKHLCQILLRNAVQYTPRGGAVTVTITETTLDSKPAISCTIKDTGIGIAKEDLPKLFMKFFRAQDAIAMVPDGAGLGLYLAKRFVEAHNGNLMVESEFKKGSSFTFILPQS